MWQHYYYWHSRRFTPHLPLFAHGRCIVLVTTGHGSLIIRIIAYHSGDHSLKIQGFIGIVTLQGSSGSTATVFIRWPYSLHTFDRVLRTSPELAGSVSRTRITHANTPTACTEITVRINKSRMLDCIVLQCGHHYLSMFLTISQPPGILTLPFQGVVQYVHHPLTIQMTKPLKQYINTPQLI
jgi:hypothetical protein